MCDEWPVCAAALRVTVLVLHVWRYDVALDTPGGPFPARSPHVSLYVQV